MSEEKILDEVIYDLGIEGLEPRKKNPVVGYIVTGAGIAALLTAIFSGAVKSNPNLSSGIMICGVLLLVAGGIMLAAVLCGKGKPYYTSTAEFLKKHERDLDIAHKDKARQYIAEGDFESLGELPPAESSAVKAVVWRTSGGDLAIAQLLEYVPHYYRPAGEIRVFRKGEFIRSAKL